jgi:hypothetical protein
MLRLWAAATVLVLSGACAAGDLSTQVPHFTGEIIQSERGSLGVIARQSTRADSVAFEIVVRQGGGAGSRSLVAGEFVTEAECGSGIMRAFAQNSYRRDGSMARTSPLPANPTKDPVYADVIERLCGGGTLRTDFNSLTEFLTTTANLD